MITDHTTPLEAWQQLSDDHFRLMNFCRQREKKAASKAKKASAFPVFEMHDYVSPVTKNPYRVFFNTYDRGGGNYETQTGYFLPVQQRQGRRIYLYVPEERTGEGDGTAYLWCINPHFLSRYRERTGFEGVGNDAELLADIYANLPEVAMSFENHKGVNRNFLNYSGGDDDECNRYMPMNNGVAFLKVTATANHRGGLPHTVVVIELRTFVDEDHLSRRQKRAIIRDVEGAVKAKTLQNREAPPTMPVQEPGESREEHLCKVKDFIDATARRHGIVIVDEDGQEKDPELPEDFDLPVLDRGTRRYVDHRIESLARKKAAAKAVPAPPKDPEFTAEQVDDILASRAAGLTLNRIATRYKTNTDVIRRVLDKHVDRLAGLIEQQTQTNTKPMKQKSEFTQKEIDKMVELYREGRTRGDLARRFGTSVSVVYDLLLPYTANLNKKEDEPAESSPETSKAVLTKEKVTGILAQVAEGVEYAVIATRFSITTKDVTDVVAGNADALSALYANKSKEAATTTEETAGQGSGRRPVDSGIIRHGVVGQKEINEIHQMAKEGLSPKDIAELIGRGEDTVKKALAKPYVEQKKSDAPLPLTKKPEMVNAVLSLRKQGGSTLTIAKELHCSKDTVSRILHAYGDPKAALTKEAAAAAATPAHKEKPKEDGKEALVVELYKKDSSMRAIRKKTGLADAEILRILKKNGITDEAEQPKTAAPKAAPAETSKDETPREPMWPESDILAMYRMRESGMSLEAIARHHGISINVLAIMMPDETPKAAAPVPARVREKTLDDFAARDIIRHLYASGYRIQDGGLYLKQDVPVREDDEEIAKLRDLGYNIDVAGLTRTKIQGVNLDDILSDIREGD